MKKCIRVAVTGAAGQIGYAILFRIASGAMFGPETEVVLQLLELEPALPALSGVAMELEDCAFPLLRGITCTSDVNAAMKDVDWAVLVGSAPRKAGMERSDLLRINGGIFSVQGQAIDAHAAQDVRVFVVGNPCNTNALIAMHHAPRVPKGNFFAMTLLDEYRAKMQLAKKASVHVSEVTRMGIWGNHSSTQYPDFYHAWIGDKPAQEVISNLDWLQETFITLVQQRGAAVIKARGASSAASAANAAIQSIYHLTHTTPQNESFSVGCCSQGEYGVDEGLIFSYPCRAVENTLHIIEGIEHNAFAQKKLESTLQELRDEREAVRALGLI